MSRLLCTSGVGVALLCCVLSTSAAEAPRLMLDVGGHSGPMSKPLFTIDGKQLITCSTDGSIRVWNVATGECLHVWYPPGRAGEQVNLGAMALSADGKRLAVAGESFHLGAAQGPRIFLIDLVKNQLERVLTAPQENIGYLTFAPDHSTLASGGGFKNLLWNLNQPAKRRALELKGHNYWLNGFDFSPDSKWIATTANDGELHISEVSTGKLTTTIKVPGGQGAYGDAHWSSDGKSILTVSPTRLFLWSPEGKQLKEIKAADLKLSGKPRGLRFSQAVRRGTTDDYLFRWSSAEPEQSGWFILDLGTHQCKKVVVHESIGKFSASILHDYVQSFSALSPDGRLAARTYSRGQSGHREQYVDVWTTATGEVVRLGGHAGAPKQLAWAREGHVLSWSGDDFSGSIDFKQLRLLPPAPFPPDHGPLHTQGTLSLRRKDKDTVEVFQAGDPKPLSTLKSFRVRSFTFIPGQQTVIIQRDEGAEFFDPSTGKKIREMHSGLRFGELTPSPDGKLVACIAGNQHVRIYDSTFAQHLLSFFVNERGWILWTPEGYYAASPGSERLMGWVVSNGPTQLGSFHPAERFRASLYRPEVIRRVLELGSVKRAIEAANKVTPLGRVVNDVSEVLPPRVRLVTPSDAVVLLTASGKLEFKAEAENTEANPVTGLELLIDNHVEQGASRGPAPQTQPNVVSQQWNVEFSKPGTYRVYVRARAACSNGASGVVLVNYAPLNGGAAARSRLHVLAIGINSYPAAPLRCAVNDARGILARFEKFAPALYDVRLHPLLNGEATRGRILDKLSVLRQDAGPDDLAVVFFAGHGFRGPEKHFYLQPFGGLASEAATTCISAKELRDALIHLRCRRVLVILDACHGGAPGELIRELADEGCGAGVLCASRDDERAGEKDDHGHFTRALMEALEGKALPTDAKNRQVLLSDVVSYVIRRVRDLSLERQNPVCPVTRNFALTQP